MKKIGLNGNKSIEFPEKWEDLSQNQLHKSFKIMMRLLGGELTPVQARIELLIMLTGYKPNHFITDPEVREHINFNLLRLSEQITFAFDLKENTIIPKYEFSRPPVPKIKIGLKKYYCKQFLLDVTAKTDITAREFVDCYDLLRGINEVEDETMKEELVNQICAILFPARTSHIENLVCGHIEEMKKVNPSVKYIVIFWFTGIVKFYTEHPVYSILFSGKKSGGSENKISLGMNEICLMLQREGYGISDTMNLNSYFDAQVKMLKDSIGKALAEGAKIEKIAEQTGLTISQINKLK